MARSFAKISVSLPIELVAQVDRIIAANGTTRSEYVAVAVREKTEREQRELMIQGYKAMAEENRKLAEEHLRAGSEVFLRNENPSKGPASGRNLRRRFQSGKRQRARGSSASTDRSK